jgi:hypothetical protein
MGDIADPAPRPVPQCKDGFATEISIPLKYFWYELLRFIFGERSTLLTTMLISEHTFSMRAWLPVEELVPESGFCYDFSVTSVPYTLELHQVFFPLFCREATCPIRLLFWLLFCYRSASHH